MTSYVYEEPGTMIPSAKLRKTAILLEHLTTEFRMMY